MDECATAIDNCDTSATCTNTVGSFTCECQAGLIGDGVICTGKFIYMTRLFSFIWMYVKILMNVMQRLIIVMPLPNVPTPLDLSLVLAQLVTKAMASRVLVSSLVSFY